MRWPETQQLITAFAVKPESLRFVGGAVRDALLAREVSDVDAATTLLPEATMALLERSGIRAIPTGIKHGTVTAVIDRKHFQITTLRRDVSTDGRHAEVAYTDDWKEDASRRDFTMNALYLTPSGELFDCFGGEMDAKAGHVRFIGDPTQRITEDYLRILRFFRFHAHYGKGAPDAAALTACSAQTTYMESLSGERIQYELFKLFSAPRASETLNIMREQNSFPPILGFAVTNVEKFVRFESIEKIMAIRIEPCVKLFEFIRAAKVTAESALAALVSRLHLSNQDEKILQIMLRHLAEVQSNMTQPQQKKLLRKLGTEHFAATVMARWVDSDEAITSDHPYAAMLTLAAQWQPPIFPVNGDDLIALGIAPGKELGDTLRTLEEFWEERNYVPSKKALLAQLKN